MRFRLLFIPLLWQSSVYAREAQKVVTDSGGSTAVASVREKDVVSSEKKKMDTWQAITEQIKRAKAQGVQSKKLQDMQEAENQKKKQGYRMRTVKNHYGAVGKIFVPDEKALLEARARLGERVINDKGRIGDKKSGFTRRSVEEVGSQYGFSEEELKEIRERGNRRTQRERYWNNLRQERSRMH